jgi:transcriptional regulator with XRE-family HTH domain
MATGRKTITEHRGNLPPALRLLRQRLNVQQKDLVEKLGVRKNRISQYERGETEPDFATLRRLLQGMGLDLHDLQDAVDAVEGRPPRSLGPPGLNPMDLVADIVRLFAQMVAREIRAQVPPAKLKPRPRAGARSSRGKKVEPGD